MCFTALDAPSDSLDVICVPIIEWYKQSERHNYRHVAGLVLVPSLDNNAYRRVGMFKDCWKGDESRWVTGKQEQIKII